jgi:signal transduction histidine kinase
LYIVKQAVDKLGGVIFLDSEERVGTTFSITIPLSSS